MTDGNLIKKLNELIPSKGVLIPTELNIVFTEGFNSHKDNFIEKDALLGKRIIKLSTNAKFWRFAIFVAYNYLDFVQEMGEIYNIKTDIKIFFDENIINFDEVEKIVENIEFWYEMNLTLNIYLEIDSEIFEDLMFYEITYHFNKD